MNTPGFQVAALDDVLRRAEDFARREPAKAAISAFGIGFLLNLLPIRALTSALVGIAFALVRPSLLFLGLLKASEFYRNQTSTPNDHE